MKAEEKIVTEKDQENLLKTSAEKLSGMSAYIDGKMKRYSLLFSVNGGAFLIAKLFTEKDTRAALGGYRRKLWRLEQSSLPS